MKELQLAAGTVTGRSHHTMLTNNQDAFHAFLEPGLAVVALCDGCSDAEQSEVGAALGARWLVEAIVRQVRWAKYDLNQDKFWEEVRLDVLAHMRTTALTLGGRFSATIKRFFLFTTLAGVITPELAVFASIGDGVIIVNNEVVDLPAMPGNKPPYMAYAMIDVDEPFPPETLVFNRHFVLPTGELQSFLVGTDGMRDFIDRQDSLFPGKDEPLRSVAQFWEDEMYFENPDQVRRTLGRANKPVVRPLWKEGRFEKFNGLLPDDTTLIAGRLVESK